MENHEEKSSNALATERTDLAVYRTLLASRRTLMGWVRTGVSLVGFGFTIYKFLKAAMGTSEISTMRAEGPRRLGLFLILLGTCSAILGAIEYMRTVQFLNTQSVKQYKVVDFTVVVGMLIALLGAFLFVTIVLNQEVF